MSRSSPKAAILSRLMRSCRASRSPLTTAGSPSLAVCHCCDTFLRRDPREEGTLEGGGISSALTTGRSSTNGSSRGTVVLGALRDRCRARGRPDSPRPSVLGAGTDGERPRLEEVTGAALVSEAVRDLVLAAIGSAAGREEAAAEARRRSSAWSSVAYICMRRAVRSALWANSCSAVIGMGVTGRLT